LVLKFFDCLSNGNSKNTCLASLAASLSGNKSRKRASLSSEENIVFTSKFLELAQKKLREKNISMDILGQLRNIVQVCGDGWTSLKDRQGRRQMRHVIWVSKSELQQIVGILAKLNRSTSGREMQRRFSSLLVSTVEAATGDKYKGEKLYRFLEKATGIPVRNRKLLKYTKESLSEVCRRDPNICQKIRAAFKRSYALLQSVMEEYEVREVSRRGRVQIIPVYINQEENIKKTRKWWFRTKSGVEYAWVPWDYFP
jgi:hypothetical protein